ncbi:MAG: cyclic GMP-AMP synthase DncV-like nucleotidyltransferase [bacterium]
MALLTKEFKTFYNEEVKFYANKEIRDKKKILKDDFNSSFPTKFKEKFDEEIKTEDIRFIDQGSYAIGTTINHGNKAYDIDVATIINLDKYMYSDPVEIKKVARDALKNTNREPKIKEPCITVKYTKKEEEKFHIDFPVYANSYGNLYLARGKEHASDENKEWQSSDPEGLNKYFKEKNLQIDSLGLSDEDKKYRKQKKRVIRYLKWWKAEKYSNSTNDNEVPPSIALTILVCNYFICSKIEDEYNDLNALYKTVNNIFNSIFYDGYDEDGNEIKKLYPCKLPVIPYSDCFEKLKRSNSYVETFYNRMKYLEKELDEACNESKERKAAEHIVKVLGNKFPLPEEDRVNKEDSFAK